MGKVIGPTLKKSSFFSNATRGSTPWARKSSSLHNRADLLLRPSKQLRKSSVLKMSFVQRRLLPTNSTLRKPLLARGASVPVSSLLVRNKSTATTTTTPTTMGIKNLLVGTQDYPPEAIARLLKSFELISQSQAKLEAEREKAASILEAKLEAEREKAASILEKLEAEREKARLEREKLEILQKSWDHEINRREKAEGAQTKAESAQLVAESRFSAVTLMRPLIEVGVQELFPELGSATKRCEEFAHRYLLRPDRKDLNDEARAILLQLEPGCDSRTVAKELLDLYHGLSKPVHSPKTLHDTTGLICAGELPLRAAVAVALVMLQRHGKLKQQIKYTNDVYQQTAWLRGGEVIAVKEESQNQ